MLQSLMIDLNVSIAHLKASLTGTASQCLCDQSPDSTDSLDDKLWRLLCDRFGNVNLTEKHRGIVQMSLKCMKEHKEC